MKYAGIYRTVSRSRGRGGLDRVDWSGADGSHSRLRLAFESLTLPRIWRIAGSGEKPAAHVIATLAPHLIEVLCYVPIDPADAAECALADHVASESVRSPADRRTALLVMADWFDERGDTRGETIRLAVGREDQA